MQLNFNNQKNSLSDKDIEQIVAIVGHKCSQKTKTRIQSILKYGPSLIPTYGIFSRLIKENDQWEYIAGQSYPDEIRTLRNCILKG